MPVSVALLVSAIIAIVGLSLSYVLLSKIRGSGNDANDADYLLVLVLLAVTGAISIALFAWSVPSTDNYQFRCHHDKETHWATNVNQMRWNSKYNQCKDWRVDIALSSQGEDAASQSLPE